MSASISVIIPAYNEAVRLGKTVRAVVDYLRQLDDIGYWARTRRRLGSAPILTMELRPIPGEEEPMTILANGKRTFMRAMAQVRS